MGGGQSGLPLWGSFSGKVLQEEGGWGEGGLQGHWGHLLGLSLELMLGLEVEVAAREQGVTLHLVRQEGEDLPY